MDRFSAIKHPQSLIAHLSRNHFSALIDLLDLSGQLYNFISIFRKHVPHHIVRIGHVRQPPDRIDLGNDLKGDGRFCYMLILDKAGKMNFLFLVQQPDPMLNDASCLFRDRHHIANRSDSRHHQVVVAGDAKDTHAFIRYACAAES